MSLKKNKKKGVGGRNEEKKTKSYQIINIIIKFTPFQSSIYLFLNLALSHYNHSSTKTKQLSTIIDILILKS